MLSEIITIPMITTLILTGLALNGVGTNSNEDIVTQTEQVKREIISKHMVRKAAEEMYLGYASDNRYKNYFEESEGIEVETVNVSENHFVLNEYIETKVGTVCSYSFDSNIGKIQECSL